MIHNISAGFITTFINFHGKKKLSLEEMFKQLSLELGGDGSKITKKQLDEYIKKAESGDVKIGKQKLTALKQIQNNWGTIAKGKDFITGGNISEFATLLIMAVMDCGEEASDSEGTSSGKSELQELMLKSLGLKDIKDATDTELNSYLKTLLSDTSDDNTVGEAIGSIINIIATRSSASTVNVEG